MLNDAVRYSRITLLHGLPRVGRTEVVTNWGKERGDIEHTAVADLHLQGAAVRFLDHFRLEDVDGLVDWYRANENDAALPRLVIAPIDLLTRRKLSDALTGSVRLIALNPMQLADFLEEHSLASGTSGPTTEIVAEPQTTISPALDPHVHWLRGGLPESLYTENDEVSFAWRAQMIQGLLNRDYSSWGIAANASLRDVLRWVANRNCGELDDADHPTMTKRDLRSALYVLRELGIIRTLSNFPEGSDESFGELPKIYVRDSGLLHAILGIETLEQLRRHPKVGDCWESYALEEMIVATEGYMSPQFYRKTVDGPGADEIDLVLDGQKLGGRIVAIECKTNPSDRPKLGFYRGCEAIGATDRFVVHAGVEPILGGAVDKLDLTSALRRLRGLALPAPN